MRRNRAGASSTTSSILQPSTPILTNQNSNSCSNDTICSSVSQSNANQTINPVNPILQNEVKIRTLLKELQSYVKKCQETRNLSEPNLTSINKTHDKIKKEEKITPFYRKKLRTLYATTLKESDNEIKCLRQALDCINQVRLTQNEIRLLQQQHSSSILSSPSILLNNATLVPNPFSLTGLSSPNDSLVDMKPAGSAVTKKVTMRRGVLMSILQQAALTLPLWVGEIGQTAPPLCGSIPPESNYICKTGDKVAAIVKNSESTGSTSGKMADGDENEEENWILAEVASYNSSIGKYDVDDIDAEEGQQRHTLAKKCVVPLPLWRANPLTDPDAIFPKDSLVLALYPQTTCFYRGIVNEAPQTPQEDYLILFEDNTYPEGYSPPLNVPQLYVVVCHDYDKK